jgi:hypothetical protein
MRWSKLKQQVENRIAESLCGRVELHTAHYRHARDSDGRSWLTIDGKELASMAHVAEHILARELSAAG